MVQGTPEWKFKSHSSYMNCKRRSKQKKCAQFFKLLYLGQTQAFKPKTKLADPQC